ncbi:hypothetical protein MMC09_001735 [Bachmanniomyces sp. S44760]|nr:hypothetical protein [Bachmanniomyces sp. S44760]
MLVLRSPLLSSFLALPAFITAASLTITIPPHLPALPSLTHSTLTTAGLSFSAPLSRSNTFTFGNLSAGNSYLAEVWTRDFVFQGLRVDVTGKGKEKETGKEKVEVWTTFRGNEWDNKGELLGVGEGSLAVEARVQGERVVYEKRGGCKFYFDVHYDYGSFPVGVDKRGERKDGHQCLAQTDQLIHDPLPVQLVSPMSLLSNPMILIGILGMGLVVGMPYLLENMDPETKAEFEEAQKKSPLAGGAAGANPLSNFDMAEWMAGKPSGAKSSGTEGEGGGSGTRNRKR